MDKLSYNDVVELALKHGFEGNPRGTKKADLIEFINANPVREEPKAEELPEEMKAEEKHEENKVEDPAPTPTEVKAEDPVPKKKNLVTAARRDTVAQMVEDKLKELVKPIEHTKLFYQIYGEDFPEGKDANNKWRDIGAALMALTNTGKVIARIPENKKRMAFAWKHEEVVPEPTAPESTGTEGDGI
jgi:hypothetical protein